LTTICSGTGRQGPAIAADLGALTPSRAISSLFPIPRRAGRPAVGIRDWRGGHAGPFESLFRREGWLAIKEELGLELLDCGASKVFAVADHQVAHIYLNDRSLESRARDLLARQPGVESVLGAKEKAELGLDHPRAGDLIAVASERAWFTYYYWLDDALAPDFARCVDIHRKPGYDPVELFLDPKIPLVKLKILGGCCKRSSASAC
jgi:predicted AlkP superfamily pyrophosphatase or phosphodiesterase